ncbi:GNAT family N-acetyltransferase [Gracilibacillus timonensis]|uniref:GNAT family N-acetyltransferase n=1 Tax=Gracilibacillus timonensis TaxID=1816696 RepID=UPI00082657F6|nr:GNAT family N-acetyltransferase [Gracilibacillus timonensis]
MTKIQLADEQHVASIIDVCTAGYRFASKDILPDAYVKRRCEEFYHTERVTKEVQQVTQAWGGYFVALENHQVIGAGGGGLISEKSAEVFVLYLDPIRRNLGIGSKLLQAITNQQKDFGAHEQWVSVQKGNQKAIPFYEARGFEFQQEVSSFESKLTDQVKSMRYRRDI